MELAQYYCLRCQFLFHKIITNSYQMIYMQGQIHIWASLGQCLGLNFEMKY
jgi:hypothetical protein